MGNKNLIYEYLVEYLNDELPENIKESYLKEIESHPEIAETFSTIVGKLQMSVQKLKLNESEIQHLHSFVANSEERLHSEMQSISNMEDLESYSSKKSKLYWIVGIVAILAFVFFYFKPAKAPVFDPLQTLSYESLALEDDSQGRIYFPTEDLNEVRTYFDTDKTLEFVPTLLEKIDPSWKITGASILDYEIAKVLLVQYENPTLNEKLFHFILKGTYSLENGDELHSDRFSFYPYASDQINMLVWQEPVQDSTSSETIVNIVASRRGIEELASIIGKALNIRIESSASEQQQATQTQPQVQPQRQQQQQPQQQQQVQSQSQPQPAANVQQQQQAAPDSKDTKATQDTTSQEQENTEPSTDSQEEQGGESLLQDGTSSESQLDIPMEEN